MNRLITFVTIIFILAGAYVYFFPWTTVRFKLTAEFDTPQGIKAGSGVVEVTYGLTLGDFISRFYLLTASVRGDAVAVDVSDNQTVYVLLSGSLPYGVLEALGDKFKDEGARRIAYIRQLNGSARLKSDDYPLIATLDEPRDKRTVKGRLPTREAYPGVRLSGVKVEVTRQQITRSIHMRLPWLTTTYFDWLWGTSFEAIPGAIVPDRYGNHQLFTQNFRR